MRFVGRSTLSKGAFTRDELKAILKEHIETVLGRYRGQVIGPEYLDLAVRWAHEADPQARLFYNDYNAEGLGTKSDAVYLLVKRLKETGVPIDGVGLQTHLTEGRPVPLADLIANMQRLGALGLEVHVTEMGVRIHGPATPAALASQAAMHHDVLQACLTVPVCRAFVTWGFTDRHSWIPDRWPEYGEAIVFDDPCRPKPAYEAPQEALQSK